MPKPTGVTLVLVSAAATVWDTSGRLVGRASLPATDEAAMALNDACRTLYGEPGSLDALLCGSEESTYASAAFLSEASRTKLRKLTDLANVDLGLWEGSLSTELEGRCPSTLKAWREQPDRIRPPEGELLTEAADRALACIRKAVEKTKLEHPRIGVVVRPMLWAALLVRTGENSWGEFWSLADQTGEIRRLDLKIADLTPQAITASA